MFEKEAKRSFEELEDRGIGDDWSIEEAYENGFSNGSEFGYNKGKQELSERLDDATEIIELMKDLFFDCWQEKGLKAIKFEQRVNDFLKENK